ncbi:hypothetical protein ACFPH6_19540 [Streptomyces xiangluensis]|uniref:Uncharacterized protein n=1 Tax=Streptomyces xiangluensis TaxID=2665720 RepID=A0ABV8YRM7_9ACTN
MTATLHLCRYCSGLITDPEDAVPVAYEPAMTGPGWTVWAHREHANLVMPDPRPLALLARIQALRAAQTNHRGENPR